MTKTMDENRRRFLAFFSSAGLGSTLLPGVLWAEMQQEAEQRVTPEMLKEALAVSGLTISDDDQKSMLQGVNRSLTGFEELRKLDIPNDVAPPFYFSTIVPGMKVNRAKEPLRFATPTVKRPANLEDVAFWPVMQLAQLIKTRQATSLELTQMYLGRLHKYNDKLNCVVTFLDEVATSQAKQADSEIAAGKYKGPLHGIPWGAKDILTVKGYKTTWGSGAYKDQMLDNQASVVDMLHGAGAVLIAKLTFRRAGSRRPLVRGNNEKSVESRRGLQRILGRTRLGHGGRMRCVRHRHRDQRIYLKPVRPLRRHRTASDLWTHQPSWSDGAFLDA